MSEPASLMVAGTYRPPAVSSNLVLRQRVLRALDDASGATVVCLQAPGGYGKTTAAAQWAARQKRPVIWLPVRPSGADARWLAQSLVTALAESGLVAEEVTLSGSAEIEAWHLDTLPAVAELVASAARPFVLIIDDAGAVSGELWARLLESTAQSLPAGAQLVLTTRDAVPDTLWKLRTSGALVVLGPRELAFDEAETAFLLRSLGVRAAAERAPVTWAQTEGWPIAVYLAGRSLKSAPNGMARAGFSHRDGFVEHLGNDILSRLPADDAAFLLRVSVLPDLDEASCDAVSGAPGSLARLRHLAVDNQLLVAQDDSAERFRMHPLLADALSEDLHDQDPQAWREAHAAASSVAEQRGDHAGSVHHARLAGDEARLARLIWSRAPHLLGSGQYAVLQRWLDGVADDVLSSHCGLALSSAWLASHVGDMARMNRLSLAATATASQDGQSCRLDADLLDATIGAHGLVQMESAASAFIAGKPVDDPWQSLSHFLLGVALFLRDEDDGAIAALEESRRVSAAFGLSVMEAHALAALADVALEHGDGGAAMPLIREARRLAARHRIDGVATTAPVFTTSAVGFIHEGRFTEARREAVRALRLTSRMRTVVPWHAVQGRLALAQVNLALGDPERARVLYDEAVAAQAPGTSSPRLDRLRKETKARLTAVAAGLAGESSLTTAEVRVLQYLPTHLSFPQIADELFVSRHTVKTQALSAYRKLGAHSRNEAITRAREAGLLPPG